MNPVTVVAAIIKKDNLYLIVQRNKHKYLGLKWEFPGGKVESGETFKEAKMGFLVLERRGVDADQVDHEKFHFHNIPPGGSLCRAGW